MSLVCLTPALASLAAPPPDRENSDTRQTEHNTVVIVSDSEVSVIFEDYMGRPPSNREARKYGELARTRHWDREHFREEFRQSDEYRLITPERAIEEAFRDLLHRAPTSREFRVYAQRMEREEWTPGQIRQAIRESEEYREIAIDRAIQRAYQELLGHRPDSESREYFREQMLRRGMSEDGLYRKIKESTEYRVTIPNEKITRAFQAVLGRTPDLRGLESYRRTVLERSMTQQDIERDLRKGPEFASHAEEIIRQAYRDLFGRDVDPKGLETYRRNMIENGWTEAKIRDDLKHSREYHPPRR